MLRTDPITLHLLEKFSAQEENKSTYKETLHYFVREKCLNVLKKMKLAEEREDVGSELVVKATAELIKRKINAEISVVLANLAKTLTLACEIGEKSTPKKRQRLKELAEKAIAQEPVKIEIISTAFEAADFEHIAENLLRIGEKKLKDAANSRPLTADSAQKSGE